MTDVENLIVKYLTNSLTPAEHEELTKWIDEPANRALFKEYVKVDYLMSQGLIDSENAPQSEKNSERITKSRMLKPLRQRWFLYSSAAAVGLLLAAIFWLQRAVSDPISEAVPVSGIAILTGSEHAVLTLEDGSEVVLEEGSTYSRKNAKVTDGQLSLSDNEDSLGVLSDTWNYLTVPRGGQYRLLLADSTQIWLNSESQLKFPVSFSKAALRTVELIYGEAYFDVSSASKHQNKGFRVFNGVQQIDVLGTEFNVKAYPDESAIFTTLVEGTVNVVYQATTRKLSPGQQAILDLSEHSLSLQQVNVYTETAWKQGVFSFRSMALKDIMKVLSRWYDCEVEFKTESLKEERFTGSLDRVMGIEDIASTLKTAGVISGYEIHQKTLILK